MHTRTWPNTFVTTDTPTASGTATPTVEASVCFVTGLSRGNPLDAPMLDLPPPGGPAVSDPGHR